MNAPLPRPGILAFESRTNASRDERGPDFRSDAFPGEAGGQSARASFAATDPRTNTTASGRPSFTRFPPPGRWPEGAYTGPPAGSTARALGLGPSLRFANLARFTV